MRVTLSRRRLAGIIACTLALGIGIGDGIARAAGWNGPVTGQAFAAVLAIVGAALIFTDALATHHRTTPHA